MLLLCATSCLSLQVPSCSFSLFKNFKFVSNFYLICKNVFINFYGNRQQNRQTQSYYCYNEGEDKA